jgi:hypothetical protein
MPMLALEPNAQISSSTDSPWLNLNVDEVMKRLDVLGNDPSLIDQDALPLCNEATFYHHVLQHNLQHNVRTVITAAQDLLKHGTCALGDLKITAGSSLLQSDYPKLLTKLQADWMLLTALCDSFHLGGHDYAGKPNRGSGSTYKKRIDWYEKSGLYKNKGIQDFDLAPLLLSSSDKMEIITTMNKAVADNSGRVHISLDITEAMIRTDRLEKHTISLEPNPPFDPSRPEGPRLVLDPNNGLTFTYWSWGKNHNWSELLVPPPFFMTIDAFFTNLDSVVIAPYD